MDYYQTLGLSRDASADDIKKAYRKLSKEYHPDKHKGDKKAEEKYKQINRAYEALSDPKKKQAYDQFGSEDGPQFGGAGGGGGFGGFGGFGSGGGFESAGGFGDIFETFFGGRRGGGGSREQGRTLEIQIAISLEDAFNGTRKTIRLKKMAACSSCSGSGQKKGSKSINCTTCNGTGQVTKTAQSFFGVIQQSMICEKCRGAGKVPEKPCGECSGEGRVKKSEEVVVDVPAGINDGQTLRIRGKGEAGRVGSEAGDLYVHIRVAPDARLVRDGNDLRAEVRIPVPDAVLGTEVKIKTFEGDVKVKIPAGTQPGQILRVKGSGMPVVNSSRRGDLFVHVVVEVPKRVGRNEKKLWEGLRNG